MKQLLKGKFKIFWEQRGFTLFEVLIAVSILAFIGTGLLTALDTNSRSTRTLDEKVVAASMAADYLEAMFLGKNRKVRHTMLIPTPMPGITSPFPFSILWLSKSNAPVMASLLVIALAAPMRPSRS